MYIKSILNKIPDALYTISDNAPLIDAARILSEKHNGIVVVCSNDGSMVGIISKTDIVRQISHCHGNSCTTMADKIMTRDIIFCKTDSLLYDVWEIMKESGITHVPVIDENNVPIAVLNAKDTLHELLKDAQYEEALLKDYVVGIGYR